MIRVIESQRKYCVACYEREPNSAYEIRFGDHSRGGVTSMTVCGECMLMLKSQMGVVKVDE